MFLKLSPQIRKWVYPSPLYVSLCSFKIPPSLPPSLQLLKTDLRQPLIYFLYTQFRAQSLEFYINEILQYVFFCVWLLSLSIIILTFIHVLHVSKFHTFYCWVVLHCLICKQFLTKFSCWWTFRLCDDFELCPQILWYYYLQGVEANFTPLFSGLDLATHF